MKSSGQILTLAWQGHLSVVSLSSSSSDDGCQLGWAPSIQLTSFIFTPIAQLCFAPKRLRCIIDAARTIYWILLGCSSWVTSRFHRTMASLQVNQTRIIQKKTEINQSRMHSYTVVHTLKVSLCFVSYVFLIHHLQKWCPTFHPHPRPVLSYCPLPCWTLQSHEFLMVNIVTVRLGYWPQCAIFSTHPSQGGGDAAVGRNMTLRCHSQRPRLAQLLSILRSDQHFSFWNK